MCRTNHLIEESLHAGHSPSLPGHSASYAMVRSAVQSLSNNQGHETYGISSARFRNSTDSLFLLLSRVISAMISGECPVDITPIIEDMKVRTYAIIDNFYAASW